MTQQDMQDAGTERLLLAPETRVTCPKCEHEFSLAEGFAKQSLEQLEQASVGALAALQAEARTKARALERQAAELRARELEDTLKERDAELAKAADERSASPPGRRRSPSRKRAWRRAWRRKPQPAPRR